MAERRPVGGLNYLDGDGEDGVKPKLPPRTGTGLSNGSGRGGDRGRNLMDDEPEDLSGLGRGWEVLQPGR